MSLIIFPMSIGSMSHVDLKKWPCRPVKFKGQEPYSNLSDLASGAEYACTMWALGLDTDNYSYHTCQQVLTLKPIFHWKLGSRWVTNANEMNTYNMKSTWPTPALCVGDPTQPIFHLLALVFLDTNMLVYPTQNSCIGGIAQRESPNAREFALQWNIGFSVNMCINKYHWRNLMLHILNLMQY